MSDIDQAKQEKKEAMKKLRQERKESIQRAAAMVKSQKKDLKSLREQVAADDGATAPEIAKATGLDVDRVIWYLATLKQYGEVVEGAKDGGYFKYTLVVKEEADKAAV
jgi:predicted transcriptional regulator